MDCRSGFQSMYPSIMIGNNVCYTTRIDPSHPEQPGKTMQHTSRLRKPSLERRTSQRIGSNLAQDLMNQRDEHKAQIKLARNDEQVEKEEFHDSMQYAVKIMMNSFYGVFASGFYRFTHKDLGSSITAWACQTSRPSSRSWKRKAITWSIPIQIPSSFVHLS